MTITYDARVFFDADLRTRLNTLLDFQNVIAAGLTLIECDLGDVPDMDAEWYAALSAVAENARRAVQALQLVTEDVA